MATALILILIAAICVIAVQSYRKKLSHGCCGAAGDDERSINQDNNDTTEYSYRYSADIDGMTCKNCSVRIENAFMRNDGIYARIDWKSGRAELFAKFPITEFAVRQTVMGLGYSVRNMEEVKNDEL